MPREAIETIVEAVGVLQAPTDDAFGSGASPWSYRNPLDTEELCETLGSRAVQRIVELVEQGDMVSMELRAVLQALSTLASQARKEVSITKQLKSQQQSIERVAKDIKAAGETIVAVKRQINEDVKSKPSYASLFHNSGRPTGPFATNARGTPRVPP